MRATRYRPICWRQSALESLHFCPLGLFGQHTTDAMSHRRLRIFELLSPMRALQSLRFPSLGLFGRLANMQTAGTRLSAKTSGLLRAHTPGTAGQWHKILVPHPLSCPSVLGQTVPGCPACKSSRSRSGLVAAEDRPRQRRPPGGRHSSAAGPVAAFSFSRCQTAQETIIICRAHLEVNGKFMS